MSKGKGKTSSAKLLDEVADATPPDAAAGDNSAAKTEDELYDTVKRLIGLDADIKTLNDTKAAIFASAKANGLNMTALRGVLADLRLDKDALAKKQEAKFEQEELASSYYDAIARAARRAGEDLGTLVATRAGARARGGA